MHRIDSTTGLLGLGKDDERLEPGPAPAPASVPSTSDTLVSRPNAMQPRLDTRTTWAEANASMFELRIPPVPSTNDLLVSAENSIIEDSVHSMATTWTEDRAEDSVISGTTWTEDSAPVPRSRSLSRKKREAARLCSRTIALYCVNLFVGLALIVGGNAIHRSSRQSRPHGEADKHHQALPEEAFYNNEDGGGGDEIINDGGP